MVAGTATALFAGPDHRVADAVEARDLNAVRALMGQRADVNGTQADGATGLHWAAHWDDLETAKSLIAAGAAVDAVNELGVSPLSIACTHSGVPMVDLLLAAGARSDLALPSGETPLMTCARTGSLNAVKSLLAHRADPNAVETERGQTALMWAIAGKHTETAQLLVENGADVRARSKGGFTPLLFAAQSGDVESARLLIARGADVNEVAPDGSSPLLVAATSVSAVTISDYRLVPQASGHEAVATLLLTRGADPNKADKLGVTPLHEAVETGKHSLVQALLAAPGVNPNLRIAKGLPYRRSDYVSRAYYAGATPFWLAAKNGDVSLMRLLLSGGADPTVPSENGTTPLMVASGVGQTDSRMVAEVRLLEAVTFLTGLGADVNAINRGGQNAVHGAASVSADDVLQFLADHGARLDLKDKQGRTPFDITQNIMRPRLSTAALLRRLGAGTRPD
jgi:ankyrin repeat protein